MTKSLLDHAHDVEHGMGMGGTADGIYKKVWMEAFRRWKKENKQSARIAALEAENKLLLAALQTANFYFPKVELLIIEGATLPAPTIRALLNGGGK